MHSTKANNFKDTNQSAANSRVISGWDGGRFGGSSAKKTPHQAGKNVPIETQNWNQPVTRKKRIVTASYNNQ